MERARVVPEQCLSRPLICIPLCLCMTVLVPLPGEALVCSCLLTRRPTCQTRGESGLMQVRQGHMTSSLLLDSFSSLRAGVCEPCRNPSWKLGIVLACTPRTWEVEVGVQDNTQLHPQLELWATLPTQTKEVKSFPENKRIK